MICDSYLPESEHTDSAVWIIRGVMVCVIVRMGVACENKSLDGSAPKQDRSIERPELLHLTPEELARMRLELVSVKQGQLLSHRQFPATVQANQNELAEVTSLIRGPVSNVYVEVGQVLEKVQVSE